MPLRRPIEDLALIMRLNHPSGVILRKVDHNVGRGGTKESVSVDTSGQNHKDNAGTRKVLGGSPRSTNNAQSLPGVPTPSNPLQQQIEQLIDVNADVETSSTNLDDIDIAVPNNDVKEIDESGYKGSRKRKPRNASFQNCANGTGWLPVASFKSRSENQESDINP